MNKFFSVIVSAALAVALTGCTKKEETPKGDSSFEKVKSAGELVLGHVDVFPPMAFVDNDSNVVGFDIDVAREVCSRLGIKLKLQRILWENKEKELKTGHIDCIWSGMSVDSSRASSMNLSDPYLTNHLVFVVKDKAIEHFDSLKGRKVSVQRASTAHSMLLKSEVGKTAEILAYENQKLAFDALDSGFVEAAFMDEVFAKYWNMKNNKGYTILKDGLHDEFYAVGFRRQDVFLRDTVNAVLNSMKKDGAFIEISLKWFGK